GYVDRAYVITNGLDNPHSLLSVVDEVSEYLPFYEVLVFQRNSPGGFYNFHRSDSRAVHVNVVNSEEGIEAAFRVDSEALPTMVIMHTDARKPHEIVTREADSILGADPPHRVNFILSTSMRPSLERIRSLMPIYSPLYWICSTCRYRYVINQNDDVTKNDLRLDGIYVPNYLM
ncbi:hypothetical protein PFISCL1PPCAC_23947, partial [Pristionchus fissidentatus]